MKMRFAVAPSVWMLAPETEKDKNSPPVFSHPAAAANCSDVPIFRLVHAVLSQNADNEKAPSQVQEFPVEATPDVPQVQPVSQLTFQCKYIQPAFGINQLVYFLN